MKLNSFERVGNCHRNCKRRNGLFPMSKVLVIIITLKPQDIFQMKLEPYIILLSFFFLLKQTDFYFVCYFESTSEIASSWQKKLFLLKIVHTLAKTLFLKHRNLTNFLQPICWYIRKLLCVLDLPQNQKPYVYLNCKYQKQVVCILCFQLSADKNNKK